MTETFDRRGTKYIKRVVNIGDKFGRLAVLDPNPNSDGLILCICNCGNEFFARKDGLYRGQTKSCGCLRREKLLKFFAVISSGDKFGRWEVLESGNFRNRAKIHCRCECGTEKYIAVKGLIEGKTKSCGCLRDEITSHRLKGIPLIPDRDYAFCLDIFLQYKNGAKIRNLEFLLTIDEVQNTIHLPCHYCGTVDSIKYLDKVSGKIYYRNGIDRVDNFLGYTIDNCVPCCSYCNRMKMDLGYNEFLHLIEKIYNYQHKIGN